MTAPPDQMEMAPHPPTARHPKKSSSLLARSKKQIPKTSETVKHNRSASDMRSDIISRPRLPSLRGERCRDEPAH